MNPNPAAGACGGRPGRELWHRASLAWRFILAEDPQDAQPGNAGPARLAADGATELVVAHNAINQALICHALVRAASGLAALTPPCPACRRPRSLRRVGLPELGLKRVLRMPLILLNPKQLSFFSPQTVSAARS